MKGVIKNDEKSSEGIKQNKKYLPSDMELMQQTYLGAIEIFSP